MDQEYIKLNQLDYKITEKGLKFLEGNNIVRIKREGGRIHLHKGDLKRHEQWEEKFSQEYFTVKQLWAYLGLKKLDNRDLTTTHYKNLTTLFKAGHIHIRELKYPLLTFYGQEEYTFVKSYVRKSEIIDILNNYVTIKEFMKMADIEYSHARSVIDKFNIRKIQFMKKLEFIFYSKEDIENFLKFRGKTLGEKIRLNIPDKDLIIMKDVYELLQLNHYTYKQFLKEGLLSISQKIGRNIFLKKEEVFSLKKQKEEMDNILRLKYYTRNEILKEFNINVDAIKIDIETIAVPLLVRGISRYFNNKLLYLKEDIIREYERRNENLNLYLDRGSIYDSLVYRVNMEGVKFANSCKETENLWFKYIRLKSDSYSSQNFVSKKTRVLEFLSSTKVLAERLLDKEIFMCSSREINLMFFNNQTGLRVKNTIYLFLKELDRIEEYVISKRRFTLSELKSPYITDNKKEIQTKVYTSEEYMKFFKYISSLDIHKNKAIASVKSVLIKSENNNLYNAFYDRYDSVWLYTLVHLNNAWRHWDCTEIPRLDFDGTSIGNSIEWIQNNEICIEDAKKIIKKIQIKNLKHSKTGAERYFYCSEQLILPIAYAAVLCEIRTRVLNPLSESLIDFQSKNRSLTSYSYKRFFCAFPDSNLKFSSLKMNRTFITLAFNLFKNYKGPAHELEILKFLRNHKSIETTNIYIHINQQDINFLSSQIFSREYFGFIADGFANILFGSTQDIAERTTQINIIYEKLGRDLRLEGIADALLFLAKQENIVEAIIKGLDKEVIQTMYNKFNMGMLHSKTRHVQCLLSPEDCMYPEREDCIGCPFAIYNFYALSAIAERILKHINFFARNDGECGFKGDYERNAILFLKDLKLFKEAELKFGSSIYEFLNVSQKEFELILIQLPSVTQYIS